jgi:hypothetical protein
VVFEAPNVAMPVGTEPVLQLPASLNEPVEGEASQVASPAIGTCFTLVRSMDGGFTVYAQGSFGRVRPRFSTNFLTRINSGLLPVSREASVVRMILTVWKPAVP